MDLSARCGVVTSTPPGCSGVIDTTIPNAHRGASGVKPCLGESNRSSWKIRQDVGDAQGCSMTFAGGRIAGKTLYRCCEAR
jgi:hypothetical protein